MLNPSNDRLNYGQILVSPAGYELDFAIGTTYSLDLDALTGACLALGLSEETDSALLDNPVCLLEALRNTGDKVVLFCEGGQIHLPNRVSSLYLLLEKMVICVNPSKNRHITSFPSFHPKFWLIRYHNKEKHTDEIYRVAFLSRNLTFDHSWDVSFYMDGQLSTTETDNNEPICDFLRYLAGQIQGNDNGRKKIKMIRNIIRELPYVNFEPAEKEFFDYQFIPNGIKKADGSYYQFNETQLFKDTFREVLIISPFVSSGIIRDFNLRNDRSSIEGARSVLITREMSLGKLKPEDVSNFKLYTLKDRVIDGESAVSDDGSDIMKQDIHAKVYMIRKYTDTDLYLGSMNASHNAVYGNVEFMIRVRAKNRHLNMDRLLTSLFGNDPDGEENPFREVTLADVLPSETDDTDDRMNAVIKSISRSLPRAVVKQEDGEHYCLLVHFNDCDLQSFQVSIHPLLFQKRESFSRAMVFTGLTLTQLSEFYVVEVSDGDQTVSRVLMIPTENMPIDREKAVVSSVVHDRECFYRYVAFLLGDDSILSAIEMNEMRDASNSQTMHRYQIPGLYEKMLITASTQPQKFAGIEYLMLSLSEDGIIPDAFKELYVKFMKVVKVNA